MNQNETAKFGEVNSSMESHAFEEVKIGEGEFLNSVRNCVICGDTINEGLLVHVESLHPEIKPKALLELFEGKIKDFKNVCRDLYVVHYVFLQQAKSYGLTKKQEENYGKIEDELNSMFKAIFDDKAY